jgi:GTPase SAR1 family protein
MIVFSIRGKRWEFRVVVMGSERVGKTSILSQFLYDQFICEYRWGQPISISGRTSVFLSSLAIRRQTGSEALWKQTTIKKEFISVPCTFLNFSRPQYSEGRLDPDPDSANMTHKGKNFQVLKCWMFSFEG